MREIVETKQELEAAESDYEQMGWEVTARALGRTVVKQGTRGDWRWHILLVILAPLYGNLVYAAYRRYNRPKYVVIRIQGAAERAAETDDLVTDLETGDSTIDDAAGDRV